MITSAIIPGSIDSDRLVIGIKTVVQMKHQQRRTNTMNRRHLSFKPPTPETDVN
jgi:hypothetical protein